MTTVEELKEYLNKWQDDVVVGGHIFLVLQGDKYMWNFGDVVVDGLIEHIHNHTAAFDAEKLEVMSYE